jgi:hypothetical protein
MSGAVLPPSMYLYGMVFNEAEWKWFSVFTFIMCHCSEFCTFKHNLICNVAVACVLRLSSVTTSLGKHGAVPPLPYVP